MLWQTTARHCAEVFLQTRGEYARLDLRRLVRKKAERRALHERASRSERLFENEFFARSTQADGRTRWIRFEHALDAAAELGAAYVCIPRQAFIRRGNEMPFDAAAKRRGCRGACS